MKWRDGCQHLKDGGMYLGSAWVPAAKKQGDCYVYPDPRGGFGVCIRVGDEDSEYFSPGRLEDLLAPKNYVIEDHYGPDTMRLFRECFYRESAKATGRE